MVALDADGRVIGTGTIARSSFGADAGEFPWVVGLVVTATAQGRGVGTAVVAALEAEAARLGYDEVFATTEAASGLLVRRGWTEIRQVDNHRVLRRSLGSE